MLQFRSVRRSLPSHRKPLAISRLRVERSNRRSGPTENCIWLGNRRAILGRPGRADLTATVRRAVMQASSNTGLLKSGAGRFIFAHVLRRAVLTVSNALTFASGTPSDCE